MVTAPHLLDLCCGAGGAAMGWAQAGFEVIGIDSDPQPSYPFEFHPMDWQAGLLQFATWADVIHASPPCQYYARVTKWRGRADDHPDLLEPTLDALRARPTPWVVENVAEAIPDPDLVLCGSMFGLSVRRHRHFLSSVPLKSPPAACRHGDLFPFMHKGERSYADAMECAWMTNREAREAIPPAYTRWIAGQVIDTLGLDVAPVGSRWSLCRHCGKAFPCQRSTARYCTDRCRLRGHRAKR
jgi:DNA (cytosine-5)-methyltransferase 1